uniref:Uncharacterized protein n=1 Tax=Brassica oleracea TaxID=3712 RepID=A0A3P6FPS8_BRAOL|nr:unnamed protein product [Brassica oleracea]
MNYHVILPFQSGESVRIVAAEERVVQNYVVQSS